MPRHMMVDIETLSTKPNAAVLQIGAAVFDPQGGPDSVGPTFLMSADEALYRVMDPVYCDDPPNPFHISEATVKWWSEQSEGARAGLLYNQVGYISTMVYEFVTWVKAQRVDRVWANSPAFDLVILRHLFDWADVKCPWHYRDELCCRTHAYLKGPVTDSMWEKANEELTQHIASDDAIRQALIVQMLEANNATTGVSDQS